MKRYLVFHNAAHYPLGGWSDFRGSFDTVAEANAYLRTVSLNAQSDWWQVVDAHTGTMEVEGGA